MFTFREVPRIHIQANIPTSQSFPSHFSAPWGRILFHGSILEKHTFENNKRLVSAWKIFFPIPKKGSFKGGHLLIQNGATIKAVTTVAPSHLLWSKDGDMCTHNELNLNFNSNSEVVEPSTEDLPEMDAKEKLRRMRISKANKGNIPWNKGRKHSEETLRKIKERTKLAMQDPKVKMKLVNLGHAQSDETKVKIGIGVRMGWQRRRERLMVQETCCFEWQNLVAEAARKGFVGEEELQWDSYRILDKQLQKEWLESIDRRRTLPRSKGNRRAPKSLEQRRKISEAISAKWADPEYRERVCAALSNYHGTLVGVERKPRRKPTGETQTVRRNLAKKTSQSRSDGSGIRKDVSTTKKRRTVPSYKDPLAKSKLEMIKKIKENRTAMETKKREATERAKLLIAEAEKAANALEVAALKNPLARSSLLETRKLIAEATRSIESIEMGKSPDTVSSPMDSDRWVNHFHTDLDGANHNIVSDKREVNGSDLARSKSNLGDFGFDKFDLRNLPNGRDCFPTIHSLEISSGETINGHGLPSLKVESSNTQLDLSSSDSLDIVEFRYAGHEFSGVAKFRDEKTETPQVRGSGSPRSTIKKWVCGRLIEVREE